MTNSRSLPEFIHALLDPARYPHPVKTVQLLETHISWVLLAGRFAYKIKKPVDFGFLDFSDLPKRHFYCAEEIRLNRRLAPSLYLEVVAIGGSPENPRFGAEPAFEYAVKMRRFAADKLMDYESIHDSLQPRHIDSLAATMAKFHAGLPPADAESDHGRPETAMRPARENFEHLLELLSGDDAERVARLQALNEDEFSRCRPLLEQRREAGKVRECHGDLHLGNIVILRDRPIPFDGIEFNPNLRWIDVISEIAFLIMDLRHRGRNDLAYRFLNAYLQASGDYAGLGVLRFYLGYRAMVRAKIAALRMTQADDPVLLSECRGYIALAERCLSTKNPALLIMQGLPGCGKTTVSQVVLEKIGAVRIRSDVERKRLFGMDAAQRSGSGVGGGIYSPEATELTYRHLLDLSRQMLADGFPVIVDAAFLKHVEREQFRRLAEIMGVPFAIVWVHSDDALQRQRIDRRQGDASEADVKVMEMLKAAAEPLQAAEQLYVVAVNNDGAQADIAGNGVLWDRLAKLGIKTS